MSRSRSRSPFPARPALKFTRSNTVFALGFIRLQFEYGRDYYFVRQQAINRLKDVQLPPGVQPVISPAGGISEIYRYQLTGPPGMDIMELKTIQDWVVERRLRIVPGVADVAVLGGNTKEYQVEVDLNRMMSYGLTLPQIISGDFRKQRQCRRPHDLDRRTVRQCPRHRRHHLAQRYRQHRSHPAGRRSGAVVERRQHPDRLQAAHRHVGPRRRDRHDHRHRADAEARTHDGGGEARPRRRPAAQHRRNAAQGREDRSLLRSRRPRRHHDRTRCCTTWCSASR